MKVAKLCIGIISIILSLILVLRSCFLATLEAFGNKADDPSASTIILAAAILLSAGIVAIAARASKGGALAAAILFTIVAALLVLSSTESASVFLVISGCFAITFLVSIFTQKYESKPAVERNS